MVDPDNASQPPPASPPDDRLHRLEERKGTFFSPLSSTPTEVGPADFPSTPVDATLVVPGEANPADFATTPINGGAPPTTDNPADE